MLLMISFTNFIVSYLVECVFINGFLQQYLWPKLKKYRPPKYKYEQLELELASMSNWPPIASINKTETLEKKKEIKIPVESELQPINCDHKEFNSLSWNFNPQSSVVGDSPTTELNHLVPNDHHHHQNNNNNNYNQASSASIIIDNQKPPTKFVTFGSPGDGSRRRNRNPQDDNHDHNNEDEQGHTDDPSVSLKSGVDGSHS